MLSNNFHGREPEDENNIPGSGGNNNSVFSGWGDVDKEASDFGYSVGNFPSGEISSGAEKQEFRISDSTAFNNLRGIAKTSYPFDPQPSQDNPNREVTSLTDSFAQSDLAGVSSLLPGKYGYNNQQSSLSNEILQEFDAGTSSYNSLPWAQTAYALENNDAGNMLGSRTSRATSGINFQSQEGINPGSIIDEHRLAFASPAEQDVPLTPFHKVYPNFGTGKVDYGFQEPGADRMSDEILRAYNAVLPEGQLAGAKKELMPVFSGVNQEAIEQRPILQSLGKIKNTLYLGGTTELPDELRIDPRQALLSGSNVPADLVQTAGELASALDSLQFYDNDSLSTGNAYGAPLRGSRTLSGGAQKMSPDFYGHLGYMGNEPVTFAGAGYEYTSNEQSIRNQ